jgi:hypothetical protein
MMKAIISPFNILCFALLTITSGVRAQYQWHIIHENQIDTFFYVFDQISCNGNNYSATGARFNYVTTPNEPFVAHSTDSGVTWSYCMVADSRKYVADFNDIQQIDSLDAIAVGYPGLIFFTKDGWATSIQDSAMYGDASSYSEVGSEDHRYTNCYFSSGSEGLISGNGGLCWTTDSGSHWGDFIDSNFDQGFGEIHSYGQGMFRVIKFQSGYPLPTRGNDILRCVLTTRDYWTTTDTSIIQYTGPLSDTTVNHNFFFGNGDTLYSLSYPADTSYHQTIMGVSPDMGAHWGYVLSAENINFKEPQITSRNRDTFVIWDIQDTAGLILVSTDDAKSWLKVTVPSPLILSHNPFYRINSVSVGSGGRVVASIDISTGDSTGVGGGSSVLAYLEPVPSSVAPAASSQTNFTLYPNPATNILNIASPAGTISISDPLGRSYEVKQTGNTLDISSLPSGVYFLSDGVSRAKFVKE